MNLLKKVNILPKIIIALIFVLLINFTVPNYIYADDIEYEDKDVKDEVDFIGAGLLKELVGVVASLADIVLGGFTKFMVGASGPMSIMLDAKDSNVQDGYLTATQEDITSEDNVVKYLQSSNMDGFIFSDWKVPNILYAPEYIFSNQIAGLDVNFVNPNTYKDATGEVVESGAAKFRSIIASWYKGLRNIAIVGLLSVLVYIGIKILVSVSTQDKAKYKQRLVDWVVAMCLIFCMHFIMAGTLMISEKITSLLVDMGNNKITVAITGVSGGKSNVDYQVDGKNVLAINTNLMGFVRLRAQTSKLGSATLYTIMYVALVIFTGMFTFTYLKRFLYMGFLTIISPLVALTYPIDKLGDGKAQAFNYWLKEFFMNAIIQPIHLLLYTVLIGSALDLVANNFLYGLIAMAFLLPAEKMIKSMFGVGTPNTSGLGEFTGGMVAMNALQNLAKQKPASLPDNKENEDKAESKYKDLSGWKKDNPAQQSTDISSNRDESVRTSSSDGITQGKDAQHDNSEDEIPSLGDTNVDNSNDENVPVLDGGNTGAEAIEEDGTEEPSLMNLQGAEPDFNDENVEGDDTGEGSQIDLQDSQGGQSDLNGGNSELGLDNHIDDEPQAPNDEDDDNRSLKQWIKDETGIGRMVTGTKKQIGKAKEGANNIKYKAVGKIKNSRMGQAVGNRVKSIPKPVRRAMKGGLMTVRRGIKGGFNAINENKGKIAKFAARSAGVVMGATIGASAAIANAESPGKAAATMITGAVAGKSIGDNAAQIGSNVIKTASNTGKNVRNAYEQETYGEERAKEMRQERTNARTKKEFLKDENERKKARDRAAKLSQANGREYSVDDVMAATWEYKKAGIQDENITGALKVETKYANGELNNRAMQEKSINAMQEAQRFSSPEYVLDEKKRTAHENYVKSMIGEQKGEEFLDMYADMMDLGSARQQQKRERANQKKQGTKQEEKQRKTKTSDELKKQREQARAKASTSPQAAADYLNNLKNSSNNNNNGSNIG